MLQSIPSLAPLLEPLSDCFRAEVFEAFCWACYGWLLAPGGRTLSGVWQALRVAARDLSHDSFYRLFARSAWDEARLDFLEARAVLDRFAPWGLVEVVLDDTLCHKRGAKVFGAGIYLDAVLSTRRHRTFRCGLNYVVLGVVVRLPERPDRDFCLPVAWRLCGKKGTPGSAKRTQRAGELVRWLAESFPERKFRVACDAAYMCQEVWRGRPANVEALGPIPGRAALYALPGPRLPGQRGRARLKGDRLPAPRELARAPARAVTVRVHGADKPLEVREAGPVLWYGGLKGQPVRVVMAHDPSGAWQDVALLCTDAHLGAESVIEGYCRRWSIEVAFRDAKQHLGLHEPQVRCANSVKRAHPMAWRTPTWAARWYADHPDAPRVIRDRPWYNEKRGVSVTDMLGAFRLQLWRESISRGPLAQADPQQIIDTLLHHLAAVG